MTDPANLKPEDQRTLNAIRRRSPAIDALVNHVRDFADMMHKLHGTLLPQWIAAATASELPQLQSFAKGMQRDLAAVTAGLTLPWNSGPVEGQVNRVILWNQICQGGVLV
jgi:transposase